MLLALAHEQAVAEKMPRPLERTALAKRVLLGHQHFVDQRRVAEKNEPLVEETKPHRIAVVALERFEKLERRTETAVNAAHEWKLFWPRNRAVGALVHGL